MKELIRLNLNTDSHLNAFEWIEGMVLNKCGEAEVKVSVAWRAFTGKVIEEVLLPLNNFLDKDIKAISVSILFL